MISKLLGNPYWQELDSFMKELSSVYEIDEVYYLPLRFKIPNQPNEFELEAQVLHSILSYLIFKEISDLFFSDLNNTSIKGYFHYSSPSRRRVCLESLNFDCHQVLEEVKNRLIDNHVRFFYTQELLKLYNSGGFDHKQVCEASQECFDMKKRLREEKDLQVVIDSLKELAVTRTKLSTYWKNL